MHAAIAYLPQDKLELHRGRNRNEVIDIPFNNYSIQSKHFDKIDFCCSFFRRTLTNIINILTKMFHTRAAVMKAEWRRPGILLRRAPIKL